MVDSFRVPDDLSGWNPDRDLGASGEFPFTRGIHPAMYRSRLWTMRQYAGFGTPAESNRRYRHLLAQGVTGLSVAFDLPTQLGYDSDHPMAGGEVGRVGVAIDTLDDMIGLFDGIPLDRVSTSMTINATAIILLSMYVAVADEQGLARTRVSGTVQNDILKEYLARGTYIYPPTPSLRLVTDIFAFAERELPQWHAISVSGYHIREAGSTAVQEVAFTLANAAAYLEAGRAAGLSAGSMGERMSFFFAAHSDFLDEIAKFRAARRIWARMMRDRFGVTTPRAQQLRFHAQTAGSTLTAQQPDNNLVRVAYQALAAVLGGAQSIHCNGRDEALALPTEESATLALRTQQIIAHEAHVTSTADPAGGSYEIEHRTNLIEAAVLDLLNRIDGWGGMPTAIEAGLVQRDIQESAFRIQRDIDSGAAPVVGVTLFPGDGGVSIPTFQFDAASERLQQVKVKGARAARNAAACQAALSSVAATARGRDNLVPPIIEAVRARATLGEISDTLRRVFGEHRESSTI